MKRWLMIMAVVGLMALTLATPVAQAASKTLYVGMCHGASPYPTVQSAVNAVNGVGFTIAVCPGTYYESVQVTDKQGLTIRGDVKQDQQAPLIDAGGQDGIVIMDSAH